MAGLSCQVMSTSVRTPVQLAWVTRDLEATENTLSALLGARRWVRMPDVVFGPDTCTYRGAPADFTATISLSYAGDMQLEIIQPTRGANIYDDFLRECGPGLHHVCVAADSPEGFTEMLAHAQAAGAEIVSAGVMPGGMEFAYVSAADSGVPYVEIAYIPSQIQSVFDHIKREQQ